MISRQSLHVVVFSYFICGPQASLHDLLTLPLYGTVNNATKFLHLAKFVGFEVSISVGGNSDLHMKERLGPPSSCQI